MSNELTPPPHAEGPEKSVLSSMLQRPDVYVTRAKAEGLIPSMFYVPSHAKLFQVLLDFDAKEKPIELISLSEWLIKNKILDSLGGPGGLSEIYTFAPSPAHFGEHLKDVRDCYARRTALVMAKKVAEAAQNGESAQDALSELSKGADEVRLATAQKKAFVAAQEAQKAFLESIKQRLETGDLPGTSTGIYQLDNIGGGMRPGEFWVICGETSAGKSVLTYQICNPALDAGEKVLIFTLEMGADEVFARLVSCRERVSLKAIMNPKNAGENGGRMTEGQKLAIGKGAQSLGAKNLLISDEPNMSIDYVISQCEQEAENGEIAVIAVDYIQLLESTRRQGESREQELSRISKQLKQLAKRMGCPVITPAQLNDDGKLRESRAIGQDADVVLKIKDDGIHVAKFRNAARNETLPLHLVGEFQRFETFHGNPNH